MVTIDEMIRATNKRVRLVYADGDVVEAFVECFLYPEEDNEEPMLLYAPEKVVFQSELARIEFL